MADYLSEATYWQFIASAKALSTNTNMIVCSKRRIKIPGLDIDAYHRHHRIAEKYELLESNDNGVEIEYTLTPKGQALLDNYLMKL